MKDQCIVLNAKKMNFDEQLDFSILKDNIQHYLYGHPINVVSNK